mmetsp:Transcript_68512/g.84029  ORF Transcript_68512/g.84029 Transcript_68512/m.84029 type:complete len:378 (+) Transcript_68512:51-1184(+)
MSELKDENGTKRKKPDDGFEVERPLKRARILAPESRDQRRVAEHYNSIHNQSRMARQHSRTIKSKKINNWVKTVLLNMFVAEGSIALDFGGGKGGDLIKWQHQKISKLVFIDHALSSVNDARDRYNGGLSELKIQYPIEMICCDLFRVNLDIILNNKLYFDVISSQFVIHYAFENKERVNALLHNVSCRLREEGCFIGTTTDDNVLIKKWRNAGPGNHTFGNRVYKIKFDTSNKNDKDFISHKKMKKYIVNDDIKEPYGIRYHFQLDDAVDCPEYLLNFNNFVNQAKKYGLQLILDMNFHEFFVRYHNHPSYSQLTQRIIIDKYCQNKYQISDDQWEISYLYKVFAFKKIKTNNKKKYPQYNITPPIRIDESDIKKY